MVVFFFCHVPSVFILSRAVTHTCNNQRAAYYSFLTAM